MTVNNGYIMKHTFFLTLALLAAMTAGAQSATPRAAATTNQVYTVVEQDPEFDGGMEALTPWLGSHVEYPAEAKAKGIEGTVFVTFVVETDGSISNVRVLNRREKMAPLEAEAERVVRAMPKWKPGRQRGKKVRVQFTLPIQFTL